jgi:hypothetical protein
MPRSSPLAREGRDQAASATASRRRHPPPTPSLSSSMVVRAEPLLPPSLTCTCRTSTSTRLRPLGILRLTSHQLTRSNHRTGSAPTVHFLPLLTTAVGMPLIPVCTITCSIPENYGGALTFRPRMQDNEKTLLFPP